jgi:hypothetical protein
MPVDVIEQVQHLVEAFDEFVDDVSTDEVLQRVGGVSDAGAPADPEAPPPHGAGRAGWRRFGLVAAAVVLVAGLVGALVWVSADRSTPSSDAPPQTGATVPTVPLGDFVWPAPPRGYTTLDDLVTAFTTEVLAWDPADTDRVGEFNDQPQPQALTLVNERLGGNVVVIAIPSPQGWGFVQVGNGGLNASVDDDQTVALRYTPSTRSASSTVEARLTDGTTVTLTASTGRLELPESVRVGELVSALVVEFDEQGNVIAATGRTYAPSDPQTPPTLPVQPAVPNSFDTVDVVGTWIVTRHERSVDDTGAKAFVPLASPLPTYRFDDDGTLSGFDGCNSMVARWSFTDGRFTTPEVTNATAAASTIRCEDSTGIPLPTVGPSPERLERIDGTITMVFTDQDGNNAHAQRLSDLPTPQQLAGSSWILAVEGPDVTVQLRHDGTVDFREDTTTCAAGSYTYDAGVLELDLEAAVDQCPDARLDELTANRLNVAVFSDDYMADTILLVPATGGAIRLFPADGDSSDTATASPIETVDGG